jgi:hypothetical protein
MLWLALATGCGARSGLEGARPSTSPRCVPTDPCIIGDADGDGHDARACGGDDCDDASAAIHPGAREHVELPGWAFSTPLAPPDAGWSPSLAPTAAGIAILHAVAPDLGCDGSLHLALRQGGEWHDETVADRVASGGYLGLAVGRDGVLHALYSNALGCATPSGTGEGGALVHAWSEGGGFSTEVVDQDPASAVGWGLSTALDPAGRLTVAYGHAQDHELRIAAQRDGGWTIETVADDLGMGRTVVGLAGCLVLVAYSTLDGDLELATRSDAGWTHETVATEVGTDPEPSIAIDGVGVPWVAYVRAATARIEVAVRLGGRWEIRRMEDGNRPALLLDATDQPHLVLTTDGSIRYLAPLGPPEELWRAGPYPEPSVALDAQGVLRVADHGEAGLVLGERIPETGVDDDCSDGR